MTKTIRKFFNSFLFAFAGIVDLFQNTPNARFHLFAGLTVIFAAWYLELALVEWAILIICIGLVIGFEAINTSIEYLTDLASPEIHPLAKKTKDMAAGAVLIMAICSLLVSILIILPKIFS